MTIQRVARRLLLSLLVLVLASLIAFTILDAAPGDAAHSMVGESASAAQLQRLRVELGLDRSLQERFLDYMMGVILRGDLGKSLISGRPVTQMIGERFLATLVLAMVAVAAAVVVGVTAGMLAAAHQGSLADLLISSGMALGLALPGFGLAMLFTLLFSLKLRLLPVAGGGTPAHLVLPALTLALPLAAVIARLTRASMLEAAQAEYVLAARARGVPGKRVWRRHILRNALVPVVTMVGLHFGHLLGGSFVVETIFGWPGLGRMIVQAVFDKDYPLILGAVLLLAVIFQLFNLAVDLAHGLLDPRVGGEAV